MPKERKKQNQTHRIFNGLRRFSNDIAHIIYIALFQYFQYFREQAQMLKARPTLVMYRPIRSLQLAEVMIMMTLMIFTTESQLILQVSLSAKTNPKLLVVAFPFS